MHTAFEASSREGLIELDFGPVLLRFQNADKTETSQILRFLRCWFVLICNPPNAEAPSKRSLQRLLGLLSQDFVGTITGLSKLGDRIAHATHVMPERDTYVKEMEKTPFYGEYHHYFKTKDASSFQYVYTCLKYGKKLDIDRSDLYPTALREWRDHEDIMRTRCGSYTGELVKDLQLCVNFLIREVGRPCLPKHGPGSTADAGKRLPSKVEALAVTPEIRSVFYGWQHAGDNLAGLPRCHGDKYHYSFSPLELSVKSSRREMVAEWLAVPKTASSVRTICQEPATQQYWQQAVMEWLVRIMQVSRISLFVDIRDQTPNQLQALMGSLDGSIDTLDLKSASDSVHGELVKAVMPRWLYKYLHATRTSRVKLPTGEVVAVEKFAPMGSATCFPVQCIIFASICFLAAVYRWTGSATGDVNIDDLHQVYAAMRRTKDPYYGILPPRVYGDDLCVDTRTTKTCLNLLAELGFTVGLEKSFIGECGFRESCGIFAIRGEDVTPVYYTLARCEAVEPGDDYTYVTSFVSHTNAIGHILPGSKLHRFLIGGLLSLRWLERDVYPVRFTRSRFDSLAVFTRAKVINQHLRHSGSWIGVRGSSSTSLQRSEIECLMVKQLKTPVQQEEARIRKDNRRIGTKVPLPEPHLNDEFRRHEWYRLTFGRRSLATHIAVPTFEPGPTGLVLDWCPA